MDKICPGYPIYHIDITRHMGFCLGSAVRHFLEAPYRSGAEDCGIARVYINLEQEMPFFLPEAQKKMLLHPFQTLTEFFSCTPGDMLWQDIADVSMNFLIHIYHYAARNDRLALDEAEQHALDLHRILSLRDTTGQIYEGMSGLPQTEPADE